MLIFPITISDKLKVTIYIKNPDEFDLIYLFQTAKALNNRFNNLLGNWLTSC
jgi:hypothetical protein